MNIFIVGAGAGGRELLTVSAAERIKNADIIIGARRVAEPFKNVCDRVFFEYEARKIKNILDKNPCENAVILFSGDISFYSGAKDILKLYPDARTEPGISCVSYFCAKARVKCDDINIISAHGRECNIVSEVRRHKKTLVLLGQNPCGKLCEYGLGGAKIIAGENLSLADEKITRGRAEDFCRTEFSPLTVMLIINENYDNRFRTGIDDNEFITGSSPMTKSEVRAVSVSKLAVGESDICIDVGAGTGTVSVEAALLCPRGKVYAIEKNPDAAELIRKNALKFQTDNIEIINGEAPRALSSIPKADKAFIGGSSGNIAEIIERCECDTIVVNAVTLQTLGAATETFSRLGYDYDVTLVSTARGVKTACYDMMKAQNPVFVIRGVR